jgi:hypothetical protein
VNEYDVAEMGAEMRGMLLQDADDRAKAERGLAGLIKVGMAIAAMRELVPDARRVVFEGPQEPGGEVTVLRVLGVGSAVLYDAGPPYYPAGEYTDPFRIEQELEEVQRLLNDALWDGVVFEQPSPADSGLYVLFLQPMSDD